MKTKAIEIKHSFEVMMALSNEVERLYQNERFTMAKLLCEDAIRIADGCSSREWVEVFESWHDLNVRRLEKIVA
jgi:hypothetical protein